MSYNPEANCANCGQYRRQHNGREEWCNTQEPMHFLEETEEKGGSMSEQKEELPVFSWGQRDDSSCWISVKAGGSHNQCDVHLSAGALRVVEKAFADAQETARLRARVAELEAGLSRMLDGDVCTHSVRGFYARCCNGCGCAMDDEPKHEDGCAVADARALLSTPNQEAGK